MKIEYPICITVLACVCIVCYTAYSITTAQQNNTTINNTTNTTNNTNNTTSNNTTLNNSNDSNSSTASTGTTSTKKKSSTSKSSSSKSNDEYYDTDMIVPGTNIHVKAKDTGYNNEGGRVYITEDGRKVNHLYSEDKYRYT